MGLGPRVCTDCHKHASRDNEGDWYCAWCGKEDDQLQFLCCMTYEQAKAWDIANEDNQHTYYKEYKQEKQGDGQ